jgi:hypothetical protein
MSNNCTFSFLHWARQEVFYWLWLGNSNPFLLVPNLRDDTMQGAVHACIPLGENYKLWSIIQLPSACDQAEIAPSAHSGASDDTVIQP